jgi:hypothetical protein
VSVIPIDVERENDTFNIGIFCTLTAEKTAPRRDACMQVVNFVFAHIFGLEEKALAESSPTLHRRRKNPSQNHLLSYCVDCRRSV